MRYKDRVRELLTPRERRFFSRLKSPLRIQDYLDTVPANFEVHGETYMSPRRTIKAKMAHCFEGALLAAAALAYHGQKPLLLDLRTISSDEDHVVALYTLNGYWGAISKTNHAMLRWRDPIYETVHELAASYFHEYIWWKTREKSLTHYSRPLDLTKYDPKKWVTAEKDLYWLVEALDNVRHFPIVPSKNKRHLRRASIFESETLLYSEEWKRPKKRR